MVDDNFHPMDESERYKAGEYDTLEEAEAQCREIVRQSLEASGWNLEGWKHYGEDPYIIGGKFSAWDYAAHLVASTQRKNTPPNSAVITPAGSSPIP